MKLALCLNEARSKISSDVRRRLLSESGFACSICGSIPVIFHHIEEWKISKSNDERYLIPICDKCHRGIHGQGGKLFTKDELYCYKHHPKKLEIIKDCLPLEHKRRYSFFLGKNFIEYGERSSLIRFPGGHHLTSIDLTSNIFKLSILSSIQNNIPVYLIKDNELLIDISMIWDMKYTGNSLKIWTVKPGISIFIDMLLYPDVIIIQRINTVFNGIPFKIYKPRVNGKRVKELANIITLLEKQYIIEIDRIVGKVDSGCQNNTYYIDENIRSVISEVIKARFLQYLEFDLNEKLKLDWLVYHNILSVSGGLKMYE